MGYNRFNSSLVGLAHGGYVLAHLALPFRAHAPLLLPAVLVALALVPLADANHPRGAVHAFQALDRRRVIITVRNNFKKRVTNGCMIHIHRGRIEFN